MKNENGFTLIELLAVITIMGILMMVAIPTVSRTIENSRKDTFIDMVRQYTSSVQNMWAADSLQCGDYTSSAVQPGVYYVEVNTTSASVPVLLEQGGKSPWGNRDVMGIIAIGIKDKGGNRVISFHPVLVDGIHGVNVKADGSDVASLWKQSMDLVRGDLVMSNAAYSIVATKSGDTWNVKTGFGLSIDLNSDGDRDDYVDGLYELNVTAIKCVER